MRGAAVLGPQGRPLRLQPVLQETTQGMAYIVIYVHVVSQHNINVYILSKYVLFYLYDYKTPFLRSYFCSYLVILNMDTIRLRDL